MIHGFEINPGVFMQMDIAHREPVFIPSAIDTPFLEDRISEGMPFPASFSMRFIEPGPDPLEALDDLVNRGVSIESRPPAPCQFCQLPQGPCKTCWRRTVVLGSLDHLEEPRRFEIPGSQFEYEFRRTAVRVQEIVREHFRYAPEGPCRGCPIVLTPCRSCYAAHWKRLQSVFHEHVEARRREARAAEEAAALMKQSVLSVQSVQSVQSIQSSVQSSVSSVSSAEAISQPGEAMETTPPAGGDVTAVPDPSSAEIGPVVAAAEPLEPMESQPSTGDDVLPACDPPSAEIKSAAVVDPSPSSSVKLDPMVGDVGVPAHDPPSAEIELAAAVEPPSAAESESASSQIAEKARRRSLQLLWATDRPESESDRDESALVIDIEAGLASTASSGAQLSDSDVLVRTPSPCGSASTHAMSYESDSCASVASLVESVVWSGPARPPVSVEPPPSDEDVGLLVRSVFPPESGVAEPSVAGRGPPSLESDPSAD